MSVDKINPEKSLIKGLTDKIKSEYVKKFPDDFLFSSDFFEEEIPGKTLVLGSEFFGNFELNTIDGSLFKMVDNILLAKYYIYSSTQKKQKIKIPSTNSELRKVVSDYEHYFDKLIKTIELEIPKSISHSEKLKIINQVILNLNLIRF